MGHGFFWGVGLGLRALGSEGADALCSECTQL